MQEIKEYAGFLMCCKKRIDSTKKVWDFDFWLKQGENKMDNYCNELRQKPLVCKKRGEWQREYDFEWLHFPLDWNQIISQSISIQLLRDSNQKAACFPATSWAEHKHNA